jgi:hypothetical protein
VRFRALLSIIVVQETSDLNKGLPTHAFVSWSGGARDADQKIRYITARSVGGFDLNAPSRLATAVMCMTGARQKRLVQSNKIGNPGQRGLPFASSA